MHFMLSGPNRPLVTLQDDAVLPPDVLTRMQAYLAHAKASEAMRSASMWDTLEAYHADMVRWIEQADHANAQAYFQDLFPGSALDGMSHGNSLFADEKRNPRE